MKIFKVSPPTCLPVPSVLNLSYQIFVTVGNQEKRQYHIDIFKIPSHRIFKFRDTSFLQDVMCATEGKRIDIVLRSLGGEVLHASWQRVGPFGKMMEIGKRDLMGHGQLRMEKPLFWELDVRMSIYSNLEVSASLGTPTAGNESLKAFLSAVAADPSILAASSSLDFLSHEIGACLCSFVHTSVEELSVTRSLVAMGIDSLVAIEVRNWWRQALVVLGLEITEIIGSENVEALGKIALEGLKAKHSAQAKQDEGIADTYLLMKAP